MLKKKEITKLFHPQNSAVKSLLLKYRERFVIIFTLYFTYIIILSLKIILRLKV